MAEVAPYVLRYWETEFSALSEGKEKEKGATRFYTARDVQIIARIRQLLYDEGFTVAGAKKRLDVEIQEGRFDDSGRPSAAAARPEPSSPVVPRSASTPVAPPPPPAPSPRASAAPPPAPAPKPAPVAAAPPVSFPERRAVIKELKEIVRLLEKDKPKKG